MKGLRSSKKEPGANRIYTAGEKEYDVMTSRIKTGIPLNKSLQEDIKIMREELNLDKYKYLF
jgi:LDH2 family malate/lactate/ureidoglycolate dehydrogenase